MWGGIIVAFWNTEVEKHFFEEALRNFSSPEQLFYNLNSHYFAYIPKDYQNNGQTLQSRNTLIGSFTEKWTRDIISPIARELGLYAVNGVVCDAIALSKTSSADLALCTTDSVNQTPDNIKLIFEIKMSIVSNWEYINQNEINYLGDYKTHKGNPSLLRSDSMLKAIGKSINIRVSGNESTKIPIVILGNSPITKTYSKKVDYLKNSGVIQGFWSLNPSPSDSDFIKETPNLGFQTILNYNQLKTNINTLLSQEINYFSSMISKPQLGELIRIADRETTDIKKAEKFLEMIRSL